MMEKQKMIRTLRHFESYLIIEITRKYKSLGLISLAMLIAGNTRYFFIFFLITKLLPMDVHKNSLKRILWLPLNRGETFLFSYIFGLFLSSFAAIIGNTFFFGNVEPHILTEITIFYSAYFGILMLATTKGVDNITFPVIFLIVDLLAGSVGDISTNKYQLFSPLYHRSIPHSLLVALIILLISFIVFILDRKEKW